MQAMNLFYSKGDVTSMNSNVYEDESLVLEHASEDEARLIAKNLIDNASYVNICRAIKLLKEEAPCTIPEIYDFEIFKLNEESLEAIEESRHPETLKTYSDIDALLEELKV